MYKNPYPEYGSNFDFLIESSLEKKIRSFCDLPDGWNSGEEIKPSSEVIEKALNFHKLIKYFTSESGFKSTAFPGDDNSIILGWIKGDNYISILLNKDGINELSIEKGFGYNFSIEEIIEKPSLSQLYEVLNRYSCLETQESLNKEGYECDSSEFLMHRNTIKKWGDSRVGALKNYTAESV